jgi:tRNA A37 N6-isopentenylltransferase MiaA
MISGLYARLIGLAVIIALIGGTLFYIHKLNGKITDLTTQNAALTTKIEIQNAAVLQLKADSDKRVADAKVAVAAAQAQAAKNKAKATVIYKTTPSTPGNACKSALDLVNGGVK